MIHFKSQMSYGCALATFSLSLLLLQHSSAELATVQGAPINNLYDNLLQREYAGPIVFPNHQVERKAQRSPSLRLRFGRSDPEMLNNIVEKRWFGDVNQKPIRSPSLRLRFGRRSDPNLPQMRRTIYDDLLERQLNLNSQQLNQQPAAADEVELSDDYDTAFERVVRKPQRLRWGRSVGNNVLDKDQRERAQLEREWQKWQNMTRWLLALQQQYDSASAAERAVGSVEDTEEDQDDNSSEFQREARKPMRLRWGRSTGKAPSEQKLPLAAETASVAPKTEN
ncbi:short neuropeptide F [Drosophila sulfurigaster albostrigata]|uniref:short neuropeptide F n=1 Tax=Drosophila sulfurigaster albostrigata TaxID=89887 RepID=UPI002D21DCE5|nr:short neuropeptide F [Drosophila sulfurigaster albostrigata]XP_062141979.1 short neuropeptide F [Drosophila sulfurigaster albostrigata]XP_062141980.1 short neuropeptide F [Drosophila sulfurigaster albostrigata]